MQLRLQLNSKIKAIMNQKYFKRYQFYLKTLPEHSKDCKDRTTNGFRHDNCFCECHDKGKYDNSNEPKD